MKRASERAMVILLAGLFGCFAGFSPAAATSTASSEQSDEASKPVEVHKSVKHKRHYAHRRSSRTAVKPSEDSADKADPSAKKSAANEVASNTVPASSAIPPFVANARAQMADADGPAAAASAMAARALDNKQAAAETAQIQPAPEIRLAQTEQLSDIDRALQEDSRPATPPTVAATEAQPRPGPATEMAAASAESSTWDQASLIGKIFIGFGALLTLASAARMFMA